MASIVLFGVVLATLGPVLIQIVEIDRWDRWGYHIRGLGQVLVAMVCILCKMESILYSLEVLYHYLFDLVCIRFRYWVWSIQVYMHGALGWCFNRYRITSKLLHFVLH